jgi:predicted metalloendopeptidase
LKVVHGDAFGNMQRAVQFQRQRNLEQLARPADPGEWRIEAESFGAIILFSPNAEFFSAGLLQAPFFDPDADAASNYGSAGAGMAHEITHILDELGNIYDEQGRLTHWWSDADLAAYHVTAAKLASQMEKNCPFADACVNGKQVLGESSADLAGLLVAHDAYVLSLHGNRDALVNGLTGEQRFFLAFAQRWRTIQTEKALREQIAGDTHAPGEYRSDLVRNVDAWYDAFGVAAGDNLYLAPEERVRVW